MSRNAPENWPNRLALDALLIGLLLALDEVVLSMAAAWLHGFWFTVLFVVMAAPLVAVLVDLSNLLFDMWPTYDEDGDEV